MSTNDIKEHSKEEIIINKTITFKNMKNKTNLRKKDVLIKEEEDIYDEESLTIKKLQQQMRSKKIFKEIENENKIIVK